MSFGNLSFVPLRRCDAEAMLAWRYPAPYEFYNGAGVTEAAVAEMLTADKQYYSVIDGAGQMIGFRTYGRAAQIDGGDYPEDALDIGGGLRPDMMARGLGRRVAVAAMAFAVEQFKPSQFRTTLPSFNERAKSICRSLGFRRWSGFERPTDGMWFEIMTVSARQAVASPFTPPAWGSSPGFPWSPSIEQGGTQAKG